MIKLKFYCNVCTYNWLAVRRVCAIREWRENEKGTGREIHKGCVKLCTFKRLWAGSSADAFQQINRSVLSANSLISFIS